MGYDAKRDRLYVALGTSVLVVPKASAASGTIYGRGLNVMYTGLRNYTEMFLDSANDVLWLGGQLGNGSVLVKICNVSTVEGAVYASGVMPQHSYSYEAYPLRSGALFSFAIDPTRSLAYVLSWGAWKCMTWLRCSPRPAGTSSGLRSTGVTTSGTFRPAASPLTGGT